jgi:hypothetical protein
MPYTKRKSSGSGFEKYCKVQLARVKKARHAGSRSKAAKAYQKCLCRKGVKTGLPAKEARKIHKRMK